MAKIEQLIEMRIKGIMEKSRTKYYWECAAFIAAWGEVSESNGVKYAKERIASKYKSQYSRRHFFTAELVFLFINEGIYASSEYEQKNNL